MINMEELMAIPEQVTATEGEEYYRTIARYVFQNGSSIASAITQLTISKFMYSQGWRTGEIYRGVFEGLLSLVNENLHKLNDSTETCALLGKLWRLPCEP